MAPDLQRVLLVEDDPDIQAVALIALEDVGGLQVEACGTGFEALERFGSFAPDLVLLDVMMPGMTGPETLRALRALPGGERVPVVFMTAKVQRGEVEEYLELGAVGVIPKPFEPMTLADELRELVSNAAPSAAGSTDDEDREFEEKLRALGAQLAEDLPARVEAMRRTWEAVLRGEVGALELVRSAHSLVGSSSTLGLPAVAAAAASIEDDPSLSAGGPLGPDDVARVNGFLDRLEAAARSGPPY